MPDNPVNETNISITADEAAKKLISHLQGLDEQRLAALEELAQLQRIKRSDLLRRKDLLAEKLGATDPAVQRLEYRYQINGSLLANLGDEIGRAKLKTPTLVNVMGNVRLGESVDASSLTVDLIDGSGKVVEAAGTATTDNQGNFNLSGSMTNDRLKEIVTTNNLFLRVRDARGNVVHLDTQPVSTGPGLVVRRDITATAGDGGDTVVEKTSPGTTLRNSWTIKSKVTDTRGQAQVGLQVCLSTKEERFDRDLPTALTDREGAFALMLKKSDFQELIATGKELFVIVKDSQGKVLYTSPEGMKWQGGKTWEKKIVIGQ